MDIPTFPGALADLEQYRIFKYVGGMEKVYIDIAEWPRGVSDWLLEAANEYAKQRQEIVNRVEVNAAPWQQRLRPAVVVNPEAAEFIDMRAMPAPPQMAAVGIEELERRWRLVNPE